MNMNGIGPIEFNGVEHNVATYPVQTIVALLRRGIRVVKSNEVAARYAAWEKKELATEGREISESESGAKKAELTSAAEQSFIDGTLGDRKRGPAVDPLEVEMERIAWRQVKETLKKAGMSVPADGEFITTGSGDKLSKEDLIDRRLVKNGPAIEKEAKKVLSNKTKAKALVGTISQAEAEAELF